MISNGHGTIQKLTQLHSPRHEVAAYDTAKDVDEYGLDVLGRREELKSPLDSGGIDGASNIEEVGRLAAVLLEHRRRNVSTEAGGKGQGVSSLHSGPWL